MKWIKAIFSIGKLKEYITLIFTAILKTRNILDYIESELDDTKVGDILEKYVPTVKKALDKVSTAVAKVLGFLGVEIQAEVVTLSKDNVDSEVAELEDALKKLEELKK